MILSTGLHVVVLSVLATRIPLRRGREAPQVSDLAVELTRAKDLAHGRTETSVATSPMLTAPPARAPAARRASPKPADRVSRTLAPTGRVGAAIGAITSAGVRTGSGQGPLPAAEMKPDLQGLLRATVGCSHQDYLQLTTEERRRCDSGFGGPNALSAGDFIAGAKRGAYGVEAAAGQRRLQRREGLLEQPVAACDGPGANLGAACLPEAALHHFTPH